MMHCRHAKPERAGTYIWLRRHSAGDIFYVDKTYNAVDWFQRCFFPWQQLYTFSRRVRNNDMVRYDDAPPAKNRERLRAAVARRLAAPVGYQ